MFSASTRGGGWPTSRICTKAPKKVDEASRAAATSRQMINSCIRSPDSSLTSRTLATSESLSSIAPTVPPPSRLAQTLAEETRHQR
jgi:hypothetical protein